VHPNCYLYYDGLFTGNYFDSLRGMLEIMKQEVLIWEHSRDSWDIVKEIIEKRINQAYWNYIFPITSSIYNILTIPLTSRLISQLESNLAFLSTANTIVLTILILQSVLGFIFITLPLQQSLRQYHAHMYIVPFDVIDKNMRLMQSLMRIRYGEFFFKLRN